MPGSGQTGRKDRASVWYVLLGGQQRKGKHEGGEGQSPHGCYREAETRGTEEDPERDRQKDRDPLREVNGVGDPHKDRSQWKNRDP